MDNSPNLQERALLEPQLTLGMRPAVIAAGLMRARSTITREMCRNGWPPTSEVARPGKTRTARTDGEYRCILAERRARVLARRPRIPRKLAPDNQLWIIVVDHLRQGLSPAQAFTGILNRFDSQLRRSRHPLVPVKYILMLDMGFVRSNLAEVKQKLERRGPDAAAPLAGFEELDRSRRAAITQSETLKAERNQISAEVAKRKQKGEDAEELMERTRSMKDAIERCTAEATAAELQMQSVLYQIPNLPGDSVPDGTSAEDNVEVRRWGTPRVFDFPAKPHWELGEQLGILNFEQAAKISGARFAVYWDAGARLERALANFMLDLHTGQHGYREVLPPFLVNEASLFGTGQLPKFREDSFHCEGSDHWLIPTAEVPLTNLYREEILDEKRLPISVTAWTPCFRAEAGAYGKDVRGLVRQHQFQKVELVKFVMPERSHEEHERLTAHAEAVLQALELPYRVMNLCAGDLGFSASKTYDLEVWLPGQNVYREISSCSNCEAFQARRANIRYRPQGQKKTEFVHTLNGSGLAVGRTWLAIVENYQQADGSVAIPAALQPYMGGLTSIRPA